MLTPTEATKTAVEFLQLWLEPEREAAAAQIAKVMCDPNQPETATTALAAQLNLSMFLLYMLAQERGATSETEIQNAADRILHELAIRLSEQRPPQVRSGMNGTGPSSPWQKTM